MKLAITGSIGLILAFPLSQSMEHKAYERGVMQTATYYECMGKWPSGAFRERMWADQSFPARDMRRDYEVMKAVNCATVKRIDAELEAGR